GGHCQYLQRKPDCGARAFHRNPYDGHTLSSQLEQATILMQDCAAAPETVFVDLGYRGVRLHEVMCAAGYNIKWLLRMIAWKGVPFLRAILLCLAKGTMPGRFWSALAASRPGDRLNDSLGVRKLWLLAA